MEALRALALRQVHMRILGTTTPRISPKKEQPKPTMNKKRTKKATTPRSRESVGVKEDRSKTGVYSTPLSKQKKIPHDSSNKRTFQPKGHSSPAGDRIVVEHSSTSMIRVVLFYSLVFFYEYSSSSVCLLHRMTTERTVFFFFVAYIAFTHDIYIQKITHGSAVDNYL